MDKIDRYERETEGMTKAERADYWQNKTGKRCNDIELEDLCPGGMELDDDYIEAMSYRNED